MTEGLISSIRNVDNETWYQISAPINPGNSGGQCVDKEGRVIGVVTKRLAEGQSIGFVRPIQDTLKIGKRY